MGQSLILSGRTAIGYKAAREYFASAGGKTQGQPHLSLSLDEIGYQIGTHALYKSDADVVMALLSGIVNGLGASELRIIPVKANESPKAEVTGTKFPDTTTYVDLFFLVNPYHPTNQVRTFSNRLIMVDTEKEKLSAYEAALSELQAEARRLFESRQGPYRANYLPLEYVQSKGLESRIVPRRELPPSWSSWEHSICIDVTPDEDTPIDKVIEVIVKSADIVQRAVTASRRLTEMQKQRGKELTRALVAQEEQQ